MEENEKTVQAAEESVETTPAPAPTPAPEKAPKKKKLKAWQIALICIGGFIVLLGIGVGLFFLIGSLNAHPREPKDVQFNNTAPDYEVSYTEAEKAIITAGMKSDASEADIKKAIALIYNKANQNKIHNTESAVAVLRGEGNASIQIGTSTPSGSMIVRGIKAQSGSEFYYQKAAPIMKCSIDELQTTLEGSLNQQERVYTDGTSDFRATGTLKGGESKIKTKEAEIEIETIPFVKVDIPDSINSYKSKDKFFEKCYYLEDPREITNFKITEDAIILKPLEEDQEYIEYWKAKDAKTGYYLCRFSLDVTNDACVEVARKYLRDSAKSDDLQYGYFDVILEVWENGYLKQMHDDEKWEGTLSTGGTTTSSTSWYETIVYYDFDETLFTEEDATEYLGDDEGATWVSRLIAHYKAELSTIKKTKTIN